MRPILSWPLKRAVIANRDERVSLFIERLSELSSPDIPCTIQPFTAPRIDTVRWLTAALKTNRRKYEEFKNTYPSLIIRPEDFVFSNEARGYRWQGRYITNALTFLHDEMSSGQSSISAGSTIEPVERAERIYKKLVLDGINRAWVNWSLLERSDIHEIVREETLDELERKLFSILNDNELHRFVILAPVGPQRGRFRGGLRELDYEKLEDVDKEAIATLTKNFSFGEEDVKRYNFIGSPKDFSKDELTKCKYFIKEVDAPDPFSVIGLFSSEIQTLQRAIDISRIPVKREDIHHRKRNVGGVFKSVLGPVFILNGGLEHIRSPLLVNEFEFQRFPIMELISESPIIIGLLQLFCKKCESMEKLVAIFSDAISATRQRRTEDAFRYLGTGLEMLLPPRGPESETYDFSGASALLVFEKIRAQFEWLNRRIVLSGKTSRLRKWQNHIIILNDEQWNEYIEEEKPRMLTRWHRETLISYLKNSATIFPRERKFFESILSCLRMRRNQLAHQAESYKDDYFLPMALDYFRTALQFRFHCYLIWLEWHLGSKLKEVMNREEKTNLENFFPEGWIEEFVAWSRLIPNLFEEISKDAFTYRKSLCLGAGFSGLSMTPLDKAPIKPLSLREDKSVSSILLSFRTFQHR